jgi:radical SAM protein with 4Fe4S-binding SPASM domain
VLYHAGESLLNRELERMIAFANGIGVERVVFNTNAGRLSGRDLSGVDELRVSFDGDSPEENDAIRVGAHFEHDARLVKSLALSDIRPITIKVYNARHGTDQPAEYLRQYFADCPGMEFEGVKIRTWARVTNEPKPAKDNVTFCSNLFETFTILSNGNVPMCCEDLRGDTIIGNVEGAEPWEIWQRMEALREAFERKEYPALCRSCWVVTG